MLPNDRLPDAAIHLHAVPPQYSDWLPTVLERLLPTTVDLCRRFFRRLYPHHAPDTPTNPLPHGSAYCVHECLIADLDVTAWNGGYAYALTDYAYRHQSDDTKTLLTTIGTTSPLLDDGLDSLDDGPLALHRHSPTPPILLLELDPDTWLTVDDPRTARTALDAITHLADVFDVRLRLTDATLVTELFTRYADHLEPHLDLTELRTRIQHRIVPATDPDNDADHVRQTAHNWIHNHPARTGHHRLLDAITHDPPTRVTTLKADTAIALADPSIDVYVEDLHDAGLITIDRHTNQSNRIHPTPAGDTVASHITADYHLRDPLQATLPTSLTANLQPSAGTVACPHQARVEGDPEKGDPAQPEAPAVVGDSPSVDRDGDGAPEHVSWQPPRAVPDPETFLATATSRDDDDEDDGFVTWLRGPASDQVLNEWTLTKRFLAPHHASGVTLVDEPHMHRWGSQGIAGSDGRTVFISDAVDGTFFVMAQYGGPLVTLARLTDALLNSKAIARVLKPEAVGDHFEELYDGAIDGFDAALEDIITHGIQIGWFGEEQHEWDGWHARYQAVRTSCLEELAEVVGTDDYARRGELMRDLHGLLASLTQLYHATDRHVVFNVRVPDSGHLRADELRYRDFLDFVRKTVPKHAVWATDTGYHSAYRTVCEDREEKVKTRLPLGHPSAAGDVATLTASWLITGRAATELLDDVQQALTREADVGVRDRVQDGTEHAPAIQIPVRNGNSLHAIRSILEEYAQRKGYKLPDSPLVQYSNGNTDMDRLLRLLMRALGTNEQPRTVSPYSVAEAMLRIAAHSHGREVLTVADLEQGLSRVSPTQVLPELPETSTAAVQTLLRADEALQKQEILEKAGISASSWQRCLGGGGPETDIRAMGIIEVTQSGRHPAYTGTLEPWWAPDAPTAETDRVLASESPAMRDILWELAHALGLEVDETLFSGVVDVDAVYEAHPELARWRWILDASFMPTAALNTEPPPRRDAVYGSAAKVEQARVATAPGNPPAWELVEADGTP
jgi:hypothetical protein